MPRLVVFLICGCSLPRTVGTACAVALTVLLSACGGPQFTLLNGTEWRGPPTEEITVYVRGEVDLSGTYGDRVAAYDLRPLRQTLSDMLHAPKVPYSVVERDGHVSFSGKTRNFLHVVSDSASAQIIVSLVVESFGYDDRDTIEDLFKRWSVAGALGVMIGDSAHGYIRASGFATERASGRVLHSFDGVGVSSLDRPRREALEEAISKAAKGMIERMFQREY